MESNRKLFLLGLCVGLAFVVAGASARKQGVTILPEQSLVVNRSNQAIPVYAPEPVEVRSSEKSPIHIRADKPIKIEWSKPQDAKWEYRAYRDAEDLMRGMRSETVQESLNKLGNEGWELVDLYVLKRLKN